MVMPLLIFYSISKDENFVIREEPCRLMIMMPLGYKTSIVGEFKIAIDEAWISVNKKIS
jgi:hypothetical protein